MDTKLSTICSLLPYSLCELKPGLTPNEYIVDKASEGDFALTIIPDGVFYLVNPDPLADAKDVRNIKVPVPSMELAQSIINDYVNALLGVTPPDVVPGLFAVAGDWSDKKIFGIKYSTQIIDCRARQARWFQNLVDMADHEWSRTRSPICVSDLQRSACRSLGFERDWLSPIPSELQEKCPVCKSVINPGALKCTTCQTVLNKVEYEKVLAGIK